MTGYDSSLHALAVLWREQKTHAALYHLVSVLECGPSIFNWVMLGQGGKHYHITPLIYLILNNILTERFPVMSYIQIVISQISKMVKNTLHYNGDTPQAALKKLCRSHLNWFQMLRTGHDPRPPPQEDKTQTQFKTEHSCLERPWLVALVAANQCSQPWGLLQDRPPLGRKRAQGVGKLKWKGISYKKEKRTDVQTYWRNRSFTSQFRSCWIKPQVTSRRRHKPPGRSDRAWEQTQTCPNIGVSAACRALTFLIFNLHLFLHWNWRTKKRLKKKKLKAIIFQLVGICWFSRGKSAHLVQNVCLYLNQPWYLVTSRDYLRVLHFLETTFISMRLQTATRGLNS